MEELPDELLLHLVSFQALSDRARFARCSKRLRAAVDDNAAWRQFYAQAFGRLEAPEMNLGRWKERVRLAYENSDYVVSGPSPAREPRLRFAWSERLPSRAVMLVVLDRANGVTRVELRDSGALASDAADGLVVTTARYVGGNRWLTRTVELFAGAPERKGAPAIFVPRASPSSEERAPKRSRRSDAVEWIESTPYSYSDMHERCFAAARRACEAIRASFRAAAEMANPHRGGVAWLCVLAREEEFDELDFDLYAVVAGVYLDKIRRLDGVVFAKADGPEPKILRTQGRRRNERELIVSLRAQRLAYVAYHGHFEPRLQRALEAIGAARVCLRAPTALEFARALRQRAIDCGGAAQICERVLRDAYEAAHPIALPDTAYVAAGDANTPYVAVHDVYEGARDLTLVVEVTAVPVVQGGPEDGAEEWAYEDPVLAWRLVVHRAYFYGAGARVGEGPLEWAPVRLVLGGHTVPGGELSEYAACDLYTSPAREHAQVVRAAREALRSLEEVACAEGLLGLRRRSDYTDFLYAGSSSLRAIVDRDGRLLMDAAWHEHASPFRVSPLLA